MVPRELGHVAQRPREREQQEVGVRDLDRLAARGPARGHEALGVELAAHVDVRDGLPAAHERADDGRPQVGDRARLPDGARRASAARWGRPRRSAAGAPRRRPAVGGRAVLDVGGDDAATRAAAAHGGEVDAQLLARRRAAGEAKRGPRAPAGAVAAAPAWRTRRRPVPATAANEPAGGEPAARSAAVMPPGARRRRCRCAGAAGARRRGGAGAPAPMRPIALSTGTISPSATRISQWAALGGLDLDLGLVGLDDRRRGRPR